MKCDKCQINEAEVYITEIGEFCLDCFNEMMAEQLDVELYENYAKNISIIDVNGKMHHFNIINEMNPMGSVWAAEEVGGDYRFEVMIDHNEDQGIGVRHLHSKIIKGISCKTLELVEESDDLENELNDDLENELHDDSVYELQRGDDRYRLKDRGTFRVEYDLEKGENCFVIDGMKVGYDEFPQLFDEYEGYSVDFQIRDASDEVLAKDMVLKPVDISVEKIYSRFERTLSWFLENDFLSHKNESNCSAALYENIDDLTLLFNYGDRDTAQSLGEKMIDRLDEIVSDSEDFPEYLVELIREIYSGNE